MAFLKSLFLNGGNAKIKVNGVTLAFCQDVSYNISVKHAAPIILGMYESTELQPLSYRVSGKFTIIRYAADLNSPAVSPAGLIAGAKDVFDVNPNGKLFNPGVPTGNHKGMEDSGNGLGYWRKGSGVLDSFKQSLNFNSPDGRVYENLNPSKLDKAASFEIELYQKIAQTEDTVPVARIRGCRITESNLSIHGRSVTTQSFAFEATYADEDSFLADFSGRGQHIT